MKEPEDFWRFTAKIRRYLGRIVFVGCVYHCISEHIVQLALCSGSSMEPTLHNRYTCLVKKNISHSDLQKGDVLILRHPSNPKKYLCKRLVGLQGDKMSKGVSGDSVVPIGYVWVEGDNHNDSNDSRNFGPVPQGLIIGKAVYISSMIVLVVNNYSKSSIQIDHHLVTKNLSIAFYTNYESTNRITADHFNHLHQKIYYSFRRKGCNQTREYIINVDEDLPTETEVHQNTDEESSEMIKNQAAACEDDSDKESQPINFLGGPEFDT